ncbi:hypothetical protein, partial [Bacillus sp. 7884-1]|uniref:hypothetical protein n=1 Tax=Bacillus sp. 7884-1 TaxID=2021693 RepID=UPI001C530388
RVLKSPVTYNTAFLIENGRHLEPRFFKINMTARKDRFYQWVLSQGIPSICMKLSILVGLN